MNIMTVLIYGWIILIVYFLPTSIANQRAHTNTRAIFWANLLFGWTCLGWGLVFVWAWTTPRSTH
jgi:hypothetical protein